MANIELATEYLRRALALLQTEIESQGVAYGIQAEPPSGDLALLAAHPDPGPVVPISSEIESQRIPPPVEADE